MSRNAVAGCHCQGGNVRSRALSGRQAPLAIYAFLELLLIILLWVSGVQGAMADQELVAISVDHPPAVDGRVDDPAWIRAPEITTRDKVSGIDIHLRAVYTAEQVFFMVRYPDPTENRVHKSLVWDKKRELYRTGPKREDTFIFKWSMDPLPVDQALSAGNPHKADIWYWKAYRTDHANHADDKLHIYSELHLPKAKVVIADNGRIFYLRRYADAGRATYRAAIPNGYKGEETPGILLQTPTGSRADVLAKGRWVDGHWTLEFARRLNTGHSDDLVFYPARNYRFGVSCYEIAGRPRKSSTEIPDHGAGDVGELLNLRFSP